MKAWLLDQLAGVKTLRIGEAPEPKPGVDEAVVSVEYAALNPADAYLAEGQYPARPALPHILGRDGVGTIVAVGATPLFKMGERVLILRGEAGVNRAGTLAERVSVPLDSLAPIPAGWSLPQAAGASLVYMTAYQALTQWDETLVHPGAVPSNRAAAGGRPSRVVLITGVSGGMGVACVQLAKAMGDTVIGLSRSEEKSGRVRELGADLVLNPADPLWPKKVREFLNSVSAAVPVSPPTLVGSKPTNASSVQAGSRRVDLAVDNVGGPLLAEVIDTLGMWGKVSLVGRLAGPVPSFNTAALFFRRLRIGGVAFSTYSGREIRAAWASVLELLAKTGAKPVVDQIFEFENVPAAFERLAAGPMGKVIVRVQGKE